MFCSMTKDCGPIADTARVTATALTASPWAIHRIRSESSSAMAIAIATASHVIEAPTKNRSSVQP